MADSSISSADTQGFRDPRWALRNSALMVFGSLVVAAVGSGKNALGTSNGGSSGSGQAAGKGPTAQSRCVWCYNNHTFLYKSPF